MYKLILYYMQPVCNFFKIISGLRSLAWELHNVQGGSGNITNIYKFHIIQSMFFFQSCQNQIICWKPGSLNNNSKDLRHGDSSASILHRFEHKDCEIWFIRFALDHHCRYMALGNQTGKVFLWQIGTSDPTGIKPATLSHPKCTSAVRQTTFSRDGRILICVCDDGTIWRWDQRDK